MLNLKVIVLVSVQRTKSDAWVKRELDHERKQVGTDEARKLTGLAGVLSLIMLLLKLVKAISGM